MLPRMSELLRVTSEYRKQLGSVALAEVAGRQWGVVTGAQLAEAGLSAPTITRWVQDGRLHRLYRGVYAVGHRALRMEGRLAAALFYAGPGAMLSHVTAAWWWELWGSEPRRIHVSAPRPRTHVDGVCIHLPRCLEGTRHRGLPVTTVARTLVDLAGSVAFADLRGALAEAEYRGLVDLGRVEAEAGPGRPGSAALRAALARHRPQLAHTLSPLEDRFVDFCDAERIPLPEVNRTVAGLMVDALWPAERVIVELDGGAAHGSPARVERDRRRDLRLRTAGYVVLRYAWGQITEQPGLVAADLRAALAEAASRLRRGGR